MRKIVRILFISILITLLFTACQENVTVPEGFYAYDKTEVEVAVESVAFQPEIPQFVPMPVEFVVSDQFSTMESNQEALDISFYTIDNDLLSIQFVEGDLEEDPIESETVEINSSIEGTYVDNSYAKILYWKNDGISYKMTYRSASVNEDTNVEEKISKEDLIKVAESFHS